MGTPLRWPPPLLCLGALLLLLAAAMPGARAKRGNCVLSSESGTLIEERHWDTVVLLNEAYGKERLRDDKENGEKYYEFTEAENIISVELTNYQEYFKVEWEDSSVFIYTGDNFKEFEKDTSVISSMFTLLIDFSCENGETDRLNVYFSIEDTNNYKPEFPDGDHFECTVTMPLLKNYDLSMLLPIAGFDYDITGKGVDAFIESSGGYSENFAATASSVVDRKFSVALTITKEVRAQEPITFTLNITDRGTQDDDKLQSETVTVTINPNLEDSVFSPRFKQPLYTTIIESSEDATSQPPLLQPIDFEEGFEEDLGYELTDGGSHSGHRADEFIDLRVEGKSVFLEWKSDLDEEKLKSFLKQPYALLILTATNSEAPLTGRTVIHMALPGAFPDVTTTPEPCPTTVTPTACPICPETPTTTECPIPTTPPEPTTPAPCTCPEIPSTTECPIPTIPPEPPTPAPCTCPEIPTTTECPTPEPPTVVSCTCPSCPTTAEPAECPPCTTAEPPPVTECPTECPSTDIPTDCPSTECPGECPSIECPLECPTESPIECPTTECPIECPSTECPVECPSTECPTECPSTECPIECPTESPIECPTTECPIECPSTVCPIECSTETSDSCECSTTECPSTECPSTDCPIECPSTECPIECPTEAPDSCECSNTECPSTECPSTECPIECPTEAPDSCECSNTECPTTECPIECSTETPGSCECSTTECPSTACPTTECPIDCSDHSCDCSSTECSAPDCSADDSNSSGNECSNCPPTTECPLVCPTTESPPQCTSTVSPGDSSEGTTSTDYLYVTGIPTDCPNCNDTYPGITDTSPTKNPGSTAGTGGNCDCSTDCPTTSTENPARSSPECPPVTKCPESNVSITSPSSILPTGDPDPDSPSDSEPDPDPPSDDLEFTEESYKKILSLDAQVGDEVVTPTLKETVNGVEYSLEEVTSSNPPEALTIDARTGVVTLATAPPSVGNWEYKLIATAGDRTAEAKLEVTVPATLACSNETWVFPQALYVMNVEEHAPRVLISGIGAKPGCVFSIDTEDPRDFSVDEATGDLSVGDVDRESERFGGVDYPVLRVELRIECEGDDIASGGDGGEDARASRVSRGTAPFWQQNVETVENNPKKMVVLAVVQDVNDWPPEMSGNTAVVGFPDADLAAQLRLPALYTVKATDKDIEENAELVYSLDDNGAKRVEVNPDTGALYPRSDVPAPEDGFQFTVRATNVVEQSDPSKPNYAELSITLRKLTADHLVEVKIEKALPEDASRLLEIAEGSGRELRVLSATVLPSSDSASDSGDDSGEDSDERSSSQETRLPHSLRARRAADGSLVYNTQLRVVVYSVLNNNLEDAEDLKGDLKKALEDDGLEVETEVADLGSSGGGNHHSSNSGLVAAVIVLGVLLGLVLLAAGFVGFWFGVRPRLAQRKSEQDFEKDKTSLHSVVADFEPLTDGMITPVSLPTKADEAEAGPSNAGTVPRLTLAPPPSGDKPRPSMLLNMEDPNEMESEDYETPREPPVPEHTYEDLDVTEPAPRKSVFFNEDVDCIEIRM